MAKSEAVTETAGAGIAAGLDKFIGVKVGEMPARPKLALGDWKFQFITHKFENKSSDRGPYTELMVTLDPVEPVAVDYPNHEDELADLRQRVRFFLGGASTARSMGDLDKMLTAMGITGLEILAVETTEDDRTILVSPALEAAKGELLIATNSETERNGKIYTNLGNYRHVDNA